MYKSIATAARNIVRLALIIDAACTLAGPPPRPPCCAAGVRHDTALVTLFDLNRRIS